MTLNKFDLKEKDSCNGNSPQEDSGWPNYPVSSSLCTGAKGLILRLCVSSANERLALMRSERMKLLRTCAEVWSWKREMRGEKEWGKETRETSRCLPCLKGRQCHLETSCNSWALLCTTMPTNLFMHIGLCCLFSTAAKVRFVFSGITVKNVKEINDCILFIWIYSEVLTLQQNSVQCASRLSDLQKEIFISVQGFLSQSFQVFARAVLDWQLSCSSAVVLPAASTQGSQAVHFPLGQLSLKCGFLNHHDILGHLAAPQQ